MKVDVHHNKDKNGIELHFTKGPDTGLAALLKSLGFKPSYRQPGKWTVRQHPAYAAFALSLQDALLKELSYSEVPVSPSYPAAPEHIENERFSLAEIHYSEDRQQKQKDYVLFEPYKRLANHIAGHFAKDVHGDSLLRVAVFERNHKTRARAAFKAGDVITGYQSEATGEVKAAKSQKNEPVVDTPPKESAQSDATRQPKANPYAYLDAVIAHMHAHYCNDKRPTRGMIEQLGKELKVPNRGMLWEAAELSWLLWYKMLYRQELSFESRLNEMIRFWNHVQPTYLYSDSSKEIYKQYSTPCPIGAIVAQYTRMDKARSILDPSAGNGLLLAGAEPGKVHANEIDPTRLASLRFQHFQKVTSHNAAHPLPKGMHRSFDVVVTNPPFSRWEEEKFDRECLVRTCFQNHIGLSRHLRLEHLMCGLALQCLKDSGRAAMIIMGHVRFGADGFIDKYRPFFNWLYRHFHVDDVINMNSFKLYNRQGAVERTMLILVSGKKQKAQGVAPDRQEAPELAEIVNSFSELWTRVKSSLCKPLQVLIQQLKTANKS